MTDLGTEPGAPCECKLGRVAAVHDLADVHDELGRRWGERGDASVRELTEQFNRRVLRSAFERSGRSPIDGEIRNFYRVLNDDDVDAGSRTRARERLREEGIEITALEEQFISHQTMYRHLVDCLDVSDASAHEDDEAIASTWVDRIRSLEARAARVTERGIEQLRSRGVIEIGSADVLVDVTVLCSDCGTFYTFEELADGRACECGVEPD
jgi:hypothetical protein